jgi:hypothetical protein
MNIYRIAGFLSLSLMCFTISCKTSRYVITITDGDTTTQKLHLQRKDGSSADTIKVHEDDKVLWRIKTKTVHAITEIADKISIAQPVFTTERKPHKKFLSKTWVVKVNRVVKDQFKDTGYVKEFYFIRWKANGTDSTKTYDPLMQIYPKKP